MDVSLKQSLERLLIARLPILALRCECQIHIERKFEGLIIEACGIRFRGRGQGATPGLVDLLRRIDQRMRDLRSGEGFAGTHMRSPKYANLPARRCKFDSYGGPCHGLEGARR